MQLLPGNRSLLPFSARIRHISHKIPADTTGPRVLDDAVCYCPGRTRRTEGHGLRNMLMGDFMRNTDRIAKVLRRSVLAAAVLAASLAAVATGASARGDEPLVVAKLGNFFVGGKHNANDQIGGQMYVEYRIPQNQKHPFPIIFVHGGGQLGVGWNETPDGREGLAPYFLRRG